ncbi:uncharacterized protein LOC121413878 isoform X2 [Lytechinus variegatus]|uniref:uncharacterized protein LOC121413878 isoform X2 n=1 Tax=Lytechinus variegatus TaxID=7654 RepID=UPI001BB2C9EC|nr:uncharacterized protein LOC121413878 isoform X2 [Lytechinus variegatus]
MPVPKQGKQDGKHLQTVKISGYFPKYNSSESRPEGRPDDEDEDNYNYDNDVDDFNEFNEDFECISTPTRERIMIRKGGKNKEIKVKGKFMVDGPWFIISFDAVLVNNVYDVQGTPTYSLRMEMGTNGEDILNKLLGYSFGFPSPKIPEGQMKEAFLTYFNQCRSRNKVKNFTFNQFFKALEEALKMEVDPDSKLLIQAAKKMIYRFDPFNKCFRGVPHDREEEEKKKQSKFDLRYIYRCYKCPVLFRVLPLLMEKEALAILSTDILSDLEDLESVLKNSPEDLGFYTTMQEHGWGRVEASFQGFVKAGLIPANLFKCTQDSTQQGLSSKPPSNRKCHHDEPSTSTAHQDNAGTSSSRQTKRPLPLSVTMAKAIKDYDLVKSLCREGKHTFVKDYMMRKAWHRDACCPNVPFGHIKEDHFVELQKRDVVTIEERIPQSETMYHWNRYRRYEEKIARALVSDLLHQTVANQSTPPTEEFSEFNLDEYQLPAVMHMWKSPVSIILGRGGCGKTHVVASYISKCLKERENEKKLKVEKAAQEGNQEATDEASDGEEKEEKDKEEGESNDNRNRVRIKAMDEPLVLLTAPTGRAASIIGRRTGLKAKTLHSVLGTARMSEPDKFIYRKVEILVVDECSLVPISVLSGVLSALLRHSLKKVIFLGDPHQLPSIDPGNFLQDIIKVFKETNSDCIHTLKKNHRTDEGGRLINENSRKIAEEKRSDLQYQPDMFELLDTSARQAGNGLDQTIKTLLESKPQLKDDRNSQFVAFRNVDVKDINGICCRHYAAHAPYKKGGGLDLHIHDKICARKNGTIVVHGEYDPKAKEKKKKERERDGEAGSSKDDGDDGCRIRRINNGDTFFIKNWRVEVEQNKKRDIVTLQSLDEEEGKVFEVNLRDLIRNFKIEYAWARTINTYQGSETDHIVYVLSPSSPYENRQHLYTAITRGRKGCIIIGTPSRLGTVIKKDPRERFTSLARFLKENLAEPQFSRCNYPGQADPRTPERQAPNNFSGSNTGVSASSPCLKSLAQEWSVRRSPLHLPAGSNPSTPASGQHQPNQWRMCEELANSLISNGHPTSRAVPVSGCESSSRSNGPSTSKAVLVSGCESSSIPNGPSFSRALPVSGCESFSRSNVPATSRAVPVSECESFSRSNGPSTSSAVLESGCESSSLGCMSLVGPVNGCGPSARATPACNQLSGNSRGSPSVGPSTTNTSSTHKARPVTANKSNPSIAPTGTSNGWSPSEKPSHGYQPLPGTSNRESPSVRPSSGYQPLPGTPNRGSPSVRPSSGYQPLPGTSNRESPSVRSSSGYQPLPGTSNRGSPTVRPLSGYQPLPGTSNRESPSVRSSSGYQPLPGTSNRESPSVRPSSGYQPLPGTSNRESPSVRPSSGYQPLPGTSNRESPSVRSSSGYQPPPGTSSRGSPSVKPSSGYQPPAGNSIGCSPSVRPSSGYQPPAGTSNRGSPSVRPSSGYQPLPGTSSRGSPSVRPSSGYQPLPGTSSRGSPSVRPSSEYQPPAGTSNRGSPSVRPSSGYQPPAGNSIGCSPSVRPSPGCQTTHPPPPGTSNGCNQSVRTSSGFHPPPITSNIGACSPLVRPSPGHQPPPGTSNGRSQSVRSSPGHQPLRSSHAYISSSRTLPACNPVAEASSAYNSSGPVPLSDQSKAVDLPTPVATEDVQPEVRAKPNRDRLSRKRKVRAVASTVNQQVSSIHNGTVPVDSGEPKKFCARGSSLAMSSESAVAGGQMQLKKDPTSIENGREQARAKETSPGKDEREMPFTSVLPREQTFVVPSRCSTDGDEKKSHSTSRSHLKRLSDTLKEDVQSAATGSKVKRLATDEKVSTVSSSRYDRLSYNDTSICPRRAVDVRESPKRLNSCSRSPLRSLSSTSRNVLKPFSSKYPQGKEKSQIISEINEMQTCSTKIQSVQQSSESSQEVQICVPGLYRGRFRFVRRLYSQDSEDQSSQNGKSTGWKEECPFEDSEDLELSQFLLQPPCAPQLHPPLNRLEECHEDADDEGSDESDDTLLSCSSDETVFSSSGTSPCLGTSGGFGDDEDEELSQFLFQHPSLQIL